jgi:tellurium resistance protein TerD
MAVNLTKGGNVNLSKEVPNLKVVKLGLGWDARSTDGAAFDLDASAFMLTAMGKVENDEGMIFYNKKVSNCGSVKHAGDNRTGDAVGDDETIEVTLDKVPANIEKIAVTVTIHDGAIRKQNFGMVSKAYIRCIDAANNNEIARYDLSEDGSTETAMIFGELYRHNGEWKFKAIGQGFAGGLAALATNYGVSV